MKNKYIHIMIVFGLFSSLCIYPGIILKALDEYGNAATTFNVGIPWTVEVMLEDMPEVKDRPSIKGLDQAYARDSSMMTMSINGKTTVKYSYKVRFDAVGTYAIGPAVVHRNGAPLSSNTLTIKIVDQPIDDNQPKDKHNVLFVRMKTDKNHVVVGEKFKCTLRCFYTDAVSQAAPSDNMQLADFVFEDGAQQTNGVETIGGKAYNYFELSWNVHAGKPGKKIIPAFGIDYIVNTNPYGSQMGAFAMMFGHSFGQKKRAYSNTVPITVDPLPAHDGPVHAVGAFSRFNAKIDPAVARSGEGMVLTLELVGHGTLNKEQGIELQDMPAQFKYYDSKQYEDKNQPDKRYFEFIVQGLQGGQWHIPLQKFTFFDTRTRTYKTLETEALAVKITAHEALHKEKQTKFSQEIDQSISDSADIKPLMLVHQECKDSGALPLWLILIIMMGSLGAVIQVPARFKKFNPRVQKNNAFSIARNEVKKITIAHAASLYTVFIQLIAARTETQVHNIDQEALYELLKKHGLPVQELDQWQQFYTQLSELMFYNKVLKPDQFKVLQQYAYSWIDRMEKIL